MKTIKITQVKSAIGRIPKHKKTLSGLGLRYIGHTVLLEDTPSIRGMIKQVSYILKIKEK